jgi:hypothetical protein
VPALQCSNCGLTYGRASPAHDLLGSTGAACPRCSSPLALAAVPAARARTNGPERHAAALRQSVAWAEDAARDGDFAGALAWLEAIEAAGGELSDALVSRRRRWSVRFDAAHAGHPAP